MSDLILSSNRTSQLLSSLIDTEVQDLSYEMQPSAPLLAKQYVKLTAENSAAGAMNGQEVTFKINRSQLLRNMYLRTTFTTTTTALDADQYPGLNMYEWIQVKSANKVLLTLSDAAIRAKVSDMGVEGQEHFSRFALPLVPTTEAVQATSTAATATYTPIFSTFFDSVKQNLDLSFYEQLMITVKFNTPARAGFNATTTITSNDLFVWTYLPDQKYLDVLRSRNQSPSKPLSMLAWNSFTERKTCTSTTSNSIRLNVNYPVFKTFISVHPIVGTIHDAFKIDTFSVNVGGITLLESMPASSVGNFESALGGATSIRTTSATAVARDDAKPICIDWSLMPQDAWTQNFGAVSWSNTNYPEITVNHQTLTTASNYELQITHFYYNIYTLSSADGSIYISIRG